MMMMMEREKGEGREVGSSCCFIRGIKMIMMVTSSSLLGKALIWWRHSKHKWRAEMACGWNLKNRGERKSEALGGWWVLEQNLEWVCFSQGPKCCFEGGGVMEKGSRTIYLGIEEIWERHESKEGGERWASLQESSIYQGFLQAFERCSNCWRRSQRKWSKW